MKHAFTLQHQSTLGITNIVFNYLELTAIANMTNSSLVSLNLTAFQGFV